MDSQKYSLFSTVRRPVSLLHGLTPLHSVSILGHPSSISVISPPAILQPSLSSVRFRSVAALTSLFAVSILQLILFFFFNWLLQLLPSLV